MSDLIKHNTRKKSALFAICITAYVQNLVGQSSIEELSIEKSRLMDWTLYNHLLFCKGEKTPLDLLPWVEYLELSDFKEHGKEEKSCALLDAT